MQTVEASAPGSLMILGEHAVLHNHPAIVASINQRITVTIKPRKDNLINIFSELGTASCFAGEIKPVAPFEFVMVALRKCMLNVGCDITIDSEFSSTIGFGSSSAVTVATIAAVQFFKAGKLNLSSVFLKARQVLHSVQGTGSGADLCASTHGGVLLYRQYPLLIQKVCDTVPITAVYSGYKKPTPQVIKFVEQQRQDNPELFKRFYTDLEAGVLTAVDHFKNQDMDGLGFCFNAAQDVLDQMNLSTTEIETIIDASDDFGAHGAKISGSGLGDCVILLGEIPENTFPADDEQKAAGIQQIPVKIGGEGVKADYV